MNRYSKLLGKKNPDEPTVVHVNIKSNYKFDSEVSKLSAKNGDLLLIKLKKGEADKSTIEAVTQCFRDMLRKLGIDAEVLVTNFDVKTERVNLEGIETLNINIQDEYITIEQLKEFKNIALCKINSIRERYKEDLIGQKNQRNIIVSR